MKKTPRCPMGIIIYIYKHIINYEQVGYVLVIHRKVKSHLPLEGTHGAR